MKCNKSTINTYSGQNRCREINHTLEKVQDPDPEESQDPNLENDLVPENVPDPEKDPDPNQEISPSLGGGKRF